MTNEQADWIQVGGMPLHRRMLLTTGRPVGAWTWSSILIVQVVLQATGVIGRSYGPVAFVVTVLLAISALLALSVVAERRNPPPRINLAAGLLRIGSDETPFADITEAIWYTLPPHTSGPATAKTEAFLLVGGAHHRKAPFCLVSPKQPVLDLGERELVAEMLRASSVRIPAPRPDPYDPNGRFAWMEHPNHLARDEAVAYVLATPSSGEPVRLPPPPKSIWND